MAKFVNVIAKIDGPQGATAAAPMLVNVDAVDNVVHFTGGCRINLRSGTGLLVAREIEDIHNLLDPPNELRI